MNNPIAFISTIDGNLLIRLIMAHLLADFIFQTKKMVENKKWDSAHMLLHIAIVFIATWALSVNFYLSIAIAILHYVADGLKISLKSKFKEKVLFVSDQLIHMVSILFVWLIYTSLWKELMDTIRMPFTNFKYSIVILSYIFISYPIGYLIGFATSNMQPKVAENHKKADKNGLLIGIFERCIILTFVLLAQYEAIGFLITGKSIIRFNSKNEDLKSEYVLLGTMMSYSITILIGVILKHLYLTS